VLEQIVGDIDDEHDIAVSETDIVLEREGRWRVRALTEIAKFNETFGTVFSDEHYDTVGGLITGELGHVPQPGDTLELDGWRFTVVDADARQVELFAVERAPEAAPAQDGAR
jgi:magnesium and cobalt transporter